MKHLFSRSYQLFVVGSPVLFLFVFLFMKCTKPEAFEPMPTIEGRWTTLIPAGAPRWQYELHDGLMTQWTEDFGTVLSHNIYPYAQRGDTLVIGGDENNPPRKWIIRLIGDGAADVTQLPVTTPGIGARYILEREN